MRRTPRLLIIEPSIGTSEHQGVSEILGDWRGDYTHLRPVLDGNGPTEQLGYDFDGVVVMGSAASVHDDFPWLDDLKDWLRPIVSGAQSVPLFGICFGHQLIGHVAGAQIGFLREDQSKLRGVEVSEVTFRMFGETRQIRAVVSHREEVKDVPNAFQLVGHRPNSTRDAFQHQSLPIYSVQFHPEARDDFATRVGIELSAIDDALKRTSGELLRSFREVVLDHAGTR